MFDYIMLSLLVVCIIGFLVTFSQYALDESNRK